MGGFFFFFWFAILVWVFGGFLCVYAWFLFLSNTQGTGNELHVVPRELCGCTCVSRVSECVCPYVRVQSVFRAPGMTSVKALKQSLYIEPRARQRLLREEPVRDAERATELSTEFSPLCSRASFHRSLLAPSR